MYFKCAQCLPSLALNVLRLSVSMTAGGSAFQSLMNQTEETFQRTWETALCCQLPLVSAGVASACQCQCSCGEPLCLKINPLSQHLVDSEHVATPTAMIQRWHVENPEPLLVWLIFYGGDQLCGSPLHLFYVPQVLLIEGSPDGVGIFKVRPHHRSEQQRQSALIQKGNAPADHGQDVQSLQNRSDCLLTELELRLSLSPASSQSPL